MNESPSPIELLLLRFEQYNKTTLELLKLKSIDKATDAASSIFSRGVQVFVLVFFILTITVAVSFWLGELLGQTYYGFLVMSAVYAIIGIILFLCHPFIKKHISNSIIKQMLH
jgi:pheromone shutdown protein TraB